jgi:hypothetical protein
MLSWGSYKMNLDAKNPYFLIGILQEFLKEMKAL